ncbi:hypothetical protein EJ065_2204 [Corallococcus coralloides]|uniref:Uncharacterized protein n=1 Tax=Corallococcus coralloides TaxID=184914 RepID=A0A410RP94_CORCK|nr:hypothetical protein [Corallococcus coralloides]QAT83787.1 hypothetical protein EJ065_2204 [Corallococcus coralloides]
MMTIARELAKLKEAIDELKELDVPHRVEPVLDAIASALKPLHDFPEELARTAAPLDRLLAQLVKELGFSRNATKAASRMLEAASVEGYDWEKPDVVNTSDRYLLHEELKVLLENLRDAHNQEAEDPEDDDVNT